MSRTAALRAAASALALLATACVSASPARDAASCSALLMKASSYAEGLADARDEQMKLMRFASEAAMNGYMGETRHLRMEALRLDELRVALSRQADLEPDYVYEPVSQPTSEGVNAAIAAADACAAAAR